MAITRDPSLFRMIVTNYWEYYRELEDEFVQTRRYVDFSDGNLHTYSVEFLKLYQAVCSEIDVLGKAMAQIANPDFKAEDKKNNILKWWYEIQSEYMITDGPFTEMNPSANVTRFRMLEYRCNLLDRLEMIPWANFEVEARVSKKNSQYYATVDGCATPDWWSDYNAVKHNRISISNSMNYSKANLGNLSKAYAALYILERALLDTVGTEEDLESFMDFSRLFTKPRKYTRTEMDLLLKKE